MKKFKLISATFLTLGLTACGGGGGGSSPSQNPTTTPDTTSPTINVSGGTSIQLTQGDSFTTPNATVSDNRDTGLTAEVSGTIDTSTPGTYTLTYTATDTAGNATSVNVSVIVVPRLFTYTGTVVDARVIGATVNISDERANCSSGITDAEGRFEINCDTQPQEGSRFLSVGGTDSLTGNDVIDLSSPVLDDIFVTPASTLNVDFIDFSVDPYDQTQPDFKSNMVTHMLSISVIKDNLDALQITETLVNDLVEAPSVSAAKQILDTQGLPNNVALSLAMVSHTTVSVLDEVNTDTSTLADSTLFVDLLSAVQSEQSDLELSTVRANITSQDLIAPVIDVTGGTEFVINTGDPFNSPQANVTDNVDNNIGVQIDGSVDTTTPGTYILTYTATDTAGNIASQDVTIVVNYLDTSAPTINLAGPSSYSITQGDDFTVPSATVSDDVDNSLEAVISGQVDTNTPGTYTITYTATDTAGNSQSVTVDVVVNPLDVTSPVITFSEGQSFAITVGDVFDNPNPIVTDDIDSDVSLTIDGFVDTAIPGDYTLTYTATDDAGNVSVQNVSVTVSAINSVALSFDFNKAVNVLTSKDVALQTVSASNRQGKGNNNERTLNEFVFIPTADLIEARSIVRAAKGGKPSKSAKAQVLSDMGFNDTQTQNAANNTASNFFVLDEDGTLRFAAESNYSFKVSYSVIDENAEFLYFAIDSNDFWTSHEFVIATEGCALFKVTIADGTWRCVAPGLLPININDEYRRTMSDVKRKPIQVDELGNVYTVAETLNLFDNDDNGTVDWVDRNYDNNRPLLYRIKQDGTVRALTGDNIEVRSFLQIDSDSIAYNYQGTNNNGLSILTNLSDDDGNISTVPIDDQNYWDGFFYALDDQNTLIYSRNNGNNTGISFSQPSVRFPGGVENYTLDTSVFSPNGWTTTPRRVLLADDGAIYGLFEESIYNQDTQTSENFANLKRILPYSTATFARINLGEDWWQYFDDGQRELQISKGYAFYLENEQHPAYSERTVIRIVRMIDGRIQTILGDDDWTQRYEIYNWKLSFNTLYFTGFDYTTSTMIQGELDTIKFRNGDAQEEYLTITESASILGSSGRIEDLEVLVATAPNNFTGSSPKIVQHFTNQENIYSASVEFNKWMDTTSVNANTFVTYPDEAGEPLTLDGVMKVWLGRRMHLIFDTDISTSSFVTDPLEKGMEYTISVGVNAMDLDGIELISGLEQGTTAETIDHSFTTRPEYGAYAGTGEVVQGITDGTVLKWAHRDGYQNQADAVLATDVKALNHRIEFSTPSRIAGKVTFKLEDPYEINWSGVDSRPVDADGNEWQHFDGFDINLMGVDATLAAKWNEQIQNDEWGQMLESRRVYDIVRETDGIVHLANERIYYREPWHQVDIDGNRYLQQWDNFSQKEVLIAVDSADRTTYTRVNGHYVHNTTGVRYFYNFGEYRDPDGNMLENGDDVTWIDDGWYDSNDERFEINLEYVNERWVNTLDASDTLANLYFNFHAHGFQYSDINDDGLIDLSTHAALSGVRTDIHGPDNEEQVMGEIAEQYQDTWSWEPDLSASNFENASFNNNNNYLQLFFGGWGYDLRDSIELYTQNLNIDDHFSNDWEGGFRDDLNASIPWVKHILTFTTDELTGEVTATYQVVDTEGNPISDVDISRELNVDINQASWSYLQDSEDKGGFRFRLMFIEQGDLAIDNLKVTDLSDDSIIMSSDFTQGNEGVFTPLY